MLMIDKCEFNEDCSTRDTYFMFCEDDDTGNYIWSIDCLFEEGEFEGEVVVPSICINPVETAKENLDELVGETFEITDVEEAEEREDLFEIYDSEPIVQYRVEIVEIQEDKIRVKCSGKINVEEELHSFKMDSWLPVIQEVSDWEKFGL